MDPIDFHIFQVVETPTPTTLLLSLKINRFIQASKITCFESDFFLLSVYVNGYLILFYILIFRSYIWPHAMYDVFLHSISLVFSICNMYGLFCWLAGPLGDDSSPPCMLAH
jgi:hypothetical protein